MFRLPFTVQETEEVSIVGFALASPNFKVRNEHFGPPRLGIARLRPHRIGQQRHEDALLALCRNAGALKRLSSKSVAIKCPKHESFLAGLGVARIGRPAMIAFEGEHRRHVLPY